MLPVAAHLISVDIACSWPSKTSPLLVVTHYSFRLVSFSLTDAALSWDHPKYKNYFSNSLWMHFLQFFHHLIMVCSYFLIFQDLIHVTTKIYRVTSLHTRSFGLICYKCMVHLWSSKAQTWFSSACFTIKDFVLWYVWYVTHSRQRIAIWKDFIVLLQKQQSRSPRWYCAYKFRRINESFCHPINLTWRFVGFTKISAFMFSICDPSQSKAGGMWVLH